MMREAALRFVSWCFGAVALVLAGCAQTADPVSDLEDLRAMPAEAFIVPADHTPPMAWAARAEADEWTLATQTALATHGRSLLLMVPSDIDAWCPHYPELSYAERGLFWTGILSRLTKHESTYDPQAVGGGGLWYGLTQILPRTAQFRNCAAQSGAALKDGSANLSCAVRIAAITVPRDGVVAAGMRGLAADWGPFHSERKREDMRQWMLSQPYCSGDMVSGDLERRRSGLFAFLGR